MVVNFDEHSKPGTHWVAIYAPGKSHAMYFDSYGGKEVPNIAKYLEENFLFLTRLNRQLQSFGSSVCGHYAIFFIYFCALKVPYENIYNFLAKTTNPDKYVRDFVIRRIDV